MARLAAATIQLSFTGPQRSKAFGALGAVIGASTALGPLLGGLIIQAAGTADGWRWVFLVNLLIGVIALPPAAWLLPRPAAQPAGDRPGRAGVAHRGPVAAAGTADRRTAGRAGAWTYLSLARPSRYWPCWRRGKCVPTSAAGTRCSSQGCSRAGSVSAGAVFAVVLRRFHQRALHALHPVADRAGPQRAGQRACHDAIRTRSLAGAANSARLSARLGRMVLVTGCLLVSAGLAGTAGLLYLTASRPGGWDLAGPLLAAGLGSGMVIPANQDFVMAYVPRREAGTASGPSTAQRIGSAIGIAVIGTVLFGTVSVRPGPDGLARAFTHAGQLALAASVAFVLLALVLVVALPRPAPSRH